MNYTEKKEWIEKLFYPTVINMFGGANYMAENFPILEWQDRFCGLDYIDNIDPEDMSAPIMIGADKSGRAFVAFKIYNPMWKEDHPFVHILFQRFSGQPDSWADGTNSGNCFRSTGYWINNGEIRGNIPDNVKRLLSGHDLVVESAVNPSESISHSYRLCYG